MSKNKPKETIEYVIRMQDKERQLLEDFNTAYMVRNFGQGIGSVLTPIVAGLSDVSFVVTMIIIYEYLTGKDTGILAGSIDSIGDLKDAWLAYRSTPEYQEEYEERATSVTGGVRNVWEQILFSLLGGPTESIFRNLGGNQD